MEISFIKVSPTRNVTVLVKSRHPRAQYPRIAAGLMDDACVGGEQVGFLETPTLPGVRARLHMMGGEFCGNATMSLGAMLAREDGLRSGECREYRLEVSGTGAPVRCLIERTEDAFVGTVDMPLPIGMSSEDGIDRVELPGITHLVIPMSRMPEQPERRIREWCRELGAEALGMILYDEERSAIRPLVYVAASDTCVWESGCGSGTAAIGCVLADRARRSIGTAVEQPGGTMGVSAEWTGERITGLRISGRVSITAEGIAWIV